jgi:hypothetical protein
VGEDCRRVGGKAGRRSFSRATLIDLRDMPSEEALPLLAIHCKPDPSFQPVKQPSTRRWHARTSVGEFEILTTGPKWYDTRARIGGGGAIDLAMHLLRLSFVDAVRILIEQDRRRG